MSGCLTCKFYAGTITYAATSLLMAMQKNTVITVEPSLDLESLFKCMIAMLVPGSGEALESLEYQVDSLHIPEFQINEKHLLNGII